VKYEYDWSKLDAGWTFEVDANVLRHGITWFKLSMLDSAYVPDEEFWRNAYTEARAQLDKCRIVDHMALRQAGIERELDALTAQYDHGSMIAAYGAPPPPADWQPLRMEPLDVAELRRIINEPQPCLDCGLHGLHICEPPTPSQPWRRGPLATWTLVNISCHDGRLTVVMRRGRGEVIIETGVDDEAIWERLALKVEGYKPGTT
jgi:hypothetical protein